ncbi:ABC transporter substrate-binding protein [Deinococcus maricopensis]|uniref:ABC-type transporter, periplasmic subunit n=1 Tax=Deinococcus maricopensis (strain DSM 21211 / LMG 22137 / NRRL B-23946 / LB-34) TaxID=709986 RepID=E8U9E9_DEIML|nr:ABC transporter substrate-binding protein [Deinococcus maricopensis]ADV67688.1 ABC-type transporter, periplasmic subunit [Deinococcus maricopensis DSM 21211]
MKKAFMLVAALTMGSAMAKPYVHAADTTVSKASDAKTGGTIRLTVAGDFDTYNPFTAQGRPNIPELTDAGGLITSDPNTGEYEGYMAESFTISPDKRTYTFTLRPELKWSDGQAITADDYISTFKIIAADEETSLNSYLFDNGKAVTWKKLGDRKLSLTFPRATVQNLETISYLTPQPDHIFGKAFGNGGAAGVKAVRDLWDVGTDVSKLVVSGPFKVSKYARGERLTLVKNSFYGQWNKDSAGKALPYLDGLQYSVVKDQNAQLAQFLAGNVDLYQPSNRDQLAQIVAAKNSGKLSVDVLANAGPNASVDFLYFNFNKSSDPFKQALFRNVKFRQAMSMLVDKDAIVDQVLGGLGVAAWTSVYPLYKDWIAPDVDKYKFNPAQANKVLDSLGFKKRGADGIRVDGKGNRLSFTLTTNGENTRRQQMARLFADEAKKAGVEVKTSFVPFNQLLGVVYPETDAGKLDRKFDASITGLSGGGFINPVGVSASLACGGELNGYNQSSKCIQPWETQQFNLFNKSTAEFDTAKRKAIANQIQKLQAENLGFIYLASQNAHYAWDSRVQGEYPKKIANPLWASSYFGPRDIALTWVSK